MIAFRCAVVILGISKPCVVDFISKTEDASGASVPIPALPDGGKMFCAIVVKIPGRRGADDPKHCEQSFGDV